MWQILFICGCWRTRIICVPPSVWGLFRCTESVRHDVYINCNIFDLLSLVFLRVLQRTHRESLNKKQKVSRAAYRARASAFERAPSDITTRREVCQGHAHCMLLCYWLTNNQNRFRHVSLGL